MQVGNTLNINTVCNEARKHLAEAYLTLALALALSSIFSGLNELEVDRAEMYWTMLCYNLA